MDYKTKRIKQFRKEYIKSYNGILSADLLEQGNDWFEKFLSETIDQCTRHTVTEEEIEQIIRKAKCKDTISGLGLYSTSDGEFTHCSIQELSTAIHNLINGKEQNE